MTSKAYLSTAEAAAHLGMTASALRMAIHRGHLRPTGRIGSRLLFTAVDLDRQVRSQESAPQVLAPEAANTDEELPQQRQKPSLSIRQRLQAVRDEK